MAHFHFGEALLPSGWSRDVRVEIDADGMIRSVNAGCAKAPGDTTIETGLPGMANLHSHAFQRGMAGLSEVRGSSNDSFWSWRQVMYSFNDHLTPEHVEAIAALAYCEMLESGFTSVGEFHYLHHARNGSAYDDPAETAARVCAAARHSGIAMTLLPVFYRYAGFGRMAPSKGQRRFINTPDSYGALFDAARKHVETLPHGQIGIAPHSLRAADADDIRAILPLAGTGPVHIHIAEQMKEVEDCLEATGKRPVQFLLDQHDIDERWCLVHATHIDADETSGLARSGAVAGLCPQTEANLGDGLFPARAFLDHGGRIGIGSDSHIRIDLAEEIRLMEYGQRLVGQARNVLGEDGQSTGRRLYEACMNGGAQALAQACGQIAPGYRADFVSLDTERSELAARRRDQLLDTWLFCGDSRFIDRVWVGGQLVVSSGRAHYREQCEADFRAAMNTLLPAI